MKSKWPWVHMCFVAPGFTETCQPLDVSYMRNFKCDLRKHLASTIVAACDSEAAVDVCSAKHVFKSLLLGLVSGACDTLVNDWPRKSGWKHLLVSDEDHASVLEEANQANAAGELFDMKAYSSR
jgi:hypothetical protein